MLRGPHRTLADIAKRRVYALHTGICGLLHLAHLPRELPALTIDSVLQSLEIGRKLNDKRFKVSGHKGYPMRWGIVLVSGLLVATGRTQKM
ncbi:hypothetical protein HED49_13370 [Ochrobactrum daejeonense]|nr:hypothetical protein [Brucella daejeonensis]